MKKKKKKEEEEKKTRDKQKTIVRQAFRESTGGNPESLEMVASGWQQCLSGSWAPFVTVVGTPRAKQIDGNWDLFDGGPRR